MEESACVCLDNDMLSRSSRRPFLVLSRHANINRDRFVFFPYHLIDDTFFPQTVSPVSSLKTSVILKEHQFHIVASPVVPERAPCSEGDFERTRVALLCALLCGLVFLVLELSLSTWPLGESDP